MAQGVRRLGLDQAKRLKTLEPKNTRLKRLVADQALDDAIVKEGAVRIASGALRRSVPHTVWSCIVSPVPFTPVKQVRGTLPCICFASPALPRPPSQHAWPARPSPRRKPHGPR